MSTVNVPYIPSWHFREGIFPSGYGIAVQKDAGYLRCLVKYVQRALEAGLYGHWLRRGLERFEALRHLGKEGGTDHDGAGLSQG